LCGSGDSLRPIMNRLFWTPLRAIYDHDAAIERLDVATVGLLGWWDEQFLPSASFFTFD
jgi:hypothetical protein